MNDDDAHGPTVLIVLDRVDLIEQTYRQFRTAGLPRMRVAGTKADLRKMLEDDKRGIILTTIFRFDKAGELNDRDNIVVLVDEAHRTTEGSLGKYMDQALPNAQFFGFTGTPIAVKDRNTFKLFGDPDDPGRVLNRYSIERSIADGASVPVHVQSRPVDFHINKAELDEEYAAMADEENLTDEERETVARQVTSVKTFMYQPDRIAAVCADIVDHYVTHVEPLGLKAQVVAYDRGLCVAYHDEITRLLEQRRDTRTTAVVMTLTKDDPLDWHQRFERSRQDEEMLRDRFLDVKDPLSLLIVTARLLTGFDAPIEGVMYLDKPLRLHTLFQAITRTNRRWTNKLTGQEKQYGLIVDYVGVGQEIGKALKDADPDRGGKRPVDVDGLLAEFEIAIAMALAPFDGIDRTDTSFAALSEAQQRIPAGDTRDGFAADFTRVQALWEFLHPHSGLVDHYTDYRWLAQVYESVQPTGVSDALLWHRLGAKTLELVHRHITDVRVTNTGLDEVIVDADAIEAIRQLALPDPSGDPAVDDPVTVGEALDTIDARIRRRLASSGGHQVYVQLAERLEKLRQAQLTQAAASIDFLKALLDLAAEVMRIERADDDGHLDDPGLLPDPRVGALTQILAEYAPAETPEIIENVVVDIDSIVKQVRFTGWAESQPGDRQVRNEIRKVLKKYGLPTGDDLFAKVYSYVRENY